MGTGEVFDELRRLIGQAAPGDLPPLAGGLAEAQAMIELRLRSVEVAPAARTTTMEPDRWITPQEAAQIANVPRTRIYGWAKGQKWAIRPSRKSLRIAERRFRAWLVTRA